MAVDSDGEFYRLRDHHAASQTLRRSTTGTCQQLHRALLTGEEFDKHRLRTFDERAQGLVVRTHPELRALPVFLQTGFESCLPCPSGTLPTLR